MKQKKRRHMNKLILKK